MFVPQRDHRVRAVPSLAILLVLVLAPELEGGQQVYVRTAAHAQAPELFWIVIFSPAERRVLMIMPQFRQTIRSLFPRARLP